MSSFSAPLVPIATLSVNPLSFVRCCYTAHIQLQGGDGTPPHACCGAWRVATPANIRGGSLSAPCQLIMSETFTSSKLLRLFLLPYMGSKPKLEYKAITQDTDIKVRCHVSLRKLVDTTYRRRKQHISTLCFWHAKGIITAVVRDKVNIPEITSGYRDDTSEFIGSKKCCYPPHTK